MLMKAPQSSSCSGLQCLLRIPMAPLGILLLLLIPPSVSLQPVLPNVCPTTHWNQNIGLFSHPSEPSLKGHDNLGSSDSSRNSAANDPFLAKVLELYEYKKQHGDVLVPKRYPPNPSLGHFVSKQRQLYRKQYIEKSMEGSYLTPERVEILNRLDFVWNATRLSPSHRGEAGDEQEWGYFYHQFSTWIASRLQELDADDANAKSCNDNENEDQYIDPDSLLVIPKETAIMLAVSEISPRSELGVWLSRQRKHYQQWMADNTTAAIVTSNSTCNNEEKHPAFSLLISTDPHWTLTPRDRLWHLRFQTLKAYQCAFGHTSVPISFRSKKLAHWVSTQRKNYNLKVKLKQPSGLTDERQELLESIGFVWNWWECQFQEDDDNDDDMIREGSRSKEYFTSTNTIVQ